MDASRRYTAVIFDFDDTLVKSYVIKWAHHIESGKRFYGMKLTDADIKKHWGKPFTQMVKDIYGDIDTTEQLIKNIRSIESEFYKEAQEDAPQIVTRFLDAGIRIGVVSAADGAFVRKDLARLGFPVEQFMAVQGCEDTTTHKPDPAVFLPMFEILKAQGIDTKDIVYVGDSVDDVRAAHGAGIACVAIATGMYDKEALIHAGAKIVLDHIRQLPDVIFK